MSFEILSRAMRMPKIHTFTQEQVVDFLSSCITRCYALAGVSKYSENDITLISITLAKDIFREYSNYTMEEIKFCFDNGVKGKYGDYYGVNISVLLYWLEKYKTSDIRQRVRKAIEEEERQKALSADNRLSSADRDMQYAREAFRRYKNGENLEMLRPPYIYKTLQDRGIIHHTREQKLEAMERFKDFKPTGGLNIPEHACQYIIKSQAMAWLLMQEFDKWGEIRA